MIIGGATSHQQYYKKLSLKRKVFLVSRRLCLRQRSLTPTLYHQPATGEPDRLLRYPFVRYVLRSRSTQPRAPDCTNRITDMSLEVLFLPIRLLEQG